MDHDSIIKTTNRIAWYATIAIIYWVFVYLIITVFDLRIFRERMTEMFFLSLLGIFAVLAGAIILNVMSNLSKISAALSQQSQSAPKVPKVRSRRWVAAFLAFPILASGLFAGDYFSANRKKALLVGAAERLIAENQPTLAELATYTFSADYVRAAEHALGVLNKIDKSFPEVRVIFPDVIDGKDVFLGFSGRDYSYTDRDKFEKLTYIYSTRADEREYLRQVYSGAEPGIKFHADNGNYELYFPVSLGGKTMVLYFSDFQQYGKLGS